MVSNEVQDGRLKSLLALQRQNAESGMRVKVLLLALRQRWGGDVRTQDNGGRNLQKPDVVEERGRGQFLKLQWIQLERLSQH